MLFKILDSLRSKPKGVRDQFSFLIAVCLTLVIGGFWSLSLPDRFNSAIPGTVAASTSTMPTAPFANLFSQFKNQFAAVKEAISASSSNDKNIEPSVIPNNNPEDMKITTENKDQINASSTNYTYIDPSADPAKSSPTILIGTSSAQSAPAQ